jgi:hypothetical protein
MPAFRSRRWKGKRESKDEKLAREFLLGMIDQTGRTYLKPNSKREKQARAATARVLRREAGRNGYWTHVVASLIDPSPRHFFIKRKIIFKRPKGTPILISDRARAEIAAFAQDELKKQKANTNTTIAQRRNLKRIMTMACDEFGIGERTFWKIWKKFRPVKPIKSTANK